MQTETGTEWKGGSILRLGTTWRTTAARGERESTPCKKSRPLLQEIANVGVSWCKAEISFGGYVSENWIAYARLHKYVYQLLSMLAVEDKEYEDPVKPMSQYKLREKRAWLCAREHTIKFGVAPAGPQMCHTRMSVCVHPTQVVYATELHRHHSTIHHTTGKTLGCAKFTDPWMEGAANSSDYA